MSFLDRPLNLPLPPPSDPQDDTEFLRARIAWLRRKLESAEDALNKIDTTDEMAARRERLLLSMKGPPPAPTWAQGGGIPVTKTELVEGRIVHTLEDGTMVMAEIVDIWRP